MTKVIEKYTGTKTYMFPNGELATPEVIAAKYPAASMFTHIVETDEQGQVMFAFQNLAAMRSIYGIDPSLTEDEAVLAIQELLNMPEPEAGATAEERIAAALEYQNLLSM